MRVSGEECIRISHLRQVYRVSDLANIGTITTAPARGRNSSAQVEFSSSAQDIEKLTQQLREQPEIREDVVSELQARIASGNYNISGEKIAEMMIRRMIADRVR